MKYLNVIITTLAVALFVGCSTTQQTSRPETATVHTTYEVFGMDCPGCHGGLEKNLLKIPGLTSASANWEKQTVVIGVERNSAIDSSAIEKAVKDSNFTLGKKVE